MRKNGFNWIKARSECTADHAFARLEEAVRSDLEKHQHTNPELSQGLEYGKCDAAKFFVKRQDVHTVVFRKVGKQITISRWSRTGDETQLLVLSIGMNKDGDCVLTDEKQGAMLLWQVRRIALEITFFGEEI